MPLKMGDDEIENPVLTGTGHNSIVSINTAFKEVPLNETAKDVQPLQSNIVQLRQQLLQKIQVQLNAIQKSRVTKDKAFDPVPMKRQKFCPD
jgi:hypothetical protein